MEELLEVVKELSFLNGQSANHGKLNVMSILAHLTKEDWAWR